MYEGSHVPLEIMSDFYGKVRMLPHAYPTYVICQNYRAHGSKVPFGSAVQVPFLHCYVNVLAG